MKSQLPNILTSRCRLMDNQSLTMHSLAGTSPLSLITILTVGMPKLIFKTKVSIVIPKFDLLEYQKISLMSLVATFTTLKKYRKVSILKISKSFPTEI